MINKSFQLLRTDPLLTSNYKVVVASNYNLYLESFNSNAELSNVRYKHLAMQKTDYLENKIPYFYRNLPVDIAFDVRYDNDNEIIQTSYDKQFDTSYFTGGYYVEDQWYVEEFDYLAPLYIRKDNLPDGFIILRLDEPSGYNLNASNNFELNSLTVDNFYEIVDNWKCVKYFDMTYTSDLGEWLYMNYTNNDRFPKTSFEYHPERTEFSYWHGMDYKSGIYTSKPIFMDDRDEIQTPHFRWEKFITEGYKNSGLIFPFILNLKFLFDDTPATPTSLKKYSMNRYYGFYVDDLEYVGSITSYRTPDMIPNTYLINNIIVSGDTGITQDMVCNLSIYEVPSLNPFVEEWDDNNEYWIYFDNTSDFLRDKTISGLYQIQRVFQDSQYIYKVISDEILDNYWNTGSTNIKTVDINYDNFNILSAVTSDFFIDKYLDCSDTYKYMYGDLYLIRIDDKYHVIKYSSGLTIQNELTINPETGDLDDYKYYIQTDYAINLNQDYLEYWILGKNSQYYKKIDINVSGSAPLTFPIFRIKFSDIKDFDFDRVVTKYSDFDYEKTEYVEKEEEKLNAYDYNEESFPHPIRVGKEGYPDQYKISNMSSEYIAADELYEIFDKGQQNTFSNEQGDENKIYILNEIWRKNQSVVKWGFMGSISHSDYPYKLNNNYDVGGPYNRTTNPYNNIPDVISKNMDYFYRLGNFYNDSGDTIYYKNQSTNIQYDFIGSQLGNGFDLNAYFGGKDGKLNFDYFTFFFKNKMYYEDKSELYIKGYDKYAVFNYGDINVPSITLFKGLKIKVREVQNVYTEEKGISRILYGNKNYNNYKISIILNENYSGNNPNLLNNTIYSENDTSTYIDTSENSIHVILNEKFENILIIINAKFPYINVTEDFPNGTTLNDITVFDERDGLYYGKKLDGSIISDYNPNLFTAFNFINAINDYRGGYGLTVKYYYIKEYEGIMRYGSTVLSRSDAQPPLFTMDIPEWDYLFPPFLLSIETPISITLNSNCYTTYPYYVNSVDDDYVATLLSFNENRTYKNKIFRYPGPYEPIFKDINLFRSGYFCYNGLSGSTDMSSGSTTKNAFIATEIFNKELFAWSNFQNICTNIANNFVEVNCPLTKTEESSRYLILKGFNFSNIPNDAIITGITMTLTRKSFVFISGGTHGEEAWVKDRSIMLARNTYIFNTKSETRESDSWDPIWSENLLNVTYGGPLDVWGDYTDGWSGSTLTGLDINDPNFGILLQVSMMNYQPIYDEYCVLPQIKCAKLTIYFVYQQTTYTVTSSVYFDNNYKFDTTLTDFGKIEEIIYSKVNETTNILENSPDMYHIYPSVDEFGYDYSNRFIFKSSWDKEFYTKTNSIFRSNPGIV